VRTREMCVKSSPASAVEDLQFALDVSRAGHTLVVRIAGELDVATRSVVRRACLTGRRRVVVVELADTTFMDCSGYGALVAARRVLQAHGGSLTLRNQSGQPADLLAMLATLESRN
jgi:anti-sigma B factor antagonist